VPAARLRSTRARLHPQDPLRHPRGMRAAQRSSGATTCA
jgi:hypothetical protein